VHTPRRSIQHIASHSRRLPPRARTPALAFLRHASLLLRQFVDELVPERALKAEMLSVFAEEQAVLAGLEGVEADMNTLAVQEDPELMEAAINRLTALQEEAERLKVSCCAQAHFVHAYVCSNMQTSLRSE
jgi:hypothetical protein